MICIDLGRAYICYFDKLLITFEDITFHETVVVADGNTFKGKFDINVHSIY